jgi:hypothetical protein
MMDRIESSKDDMDIREAYPLMDVIAHQEGWNDPEMDSYNIYARKPQFHPPNDDEKGQPYESTI